MKKTRIIYWVTTALIVFIMGVSAVSYLLRVEHFVESTRALGYPLYLMSILGVAKLLGILTLLLPRFPKLKEWAYAGFVFNLIGAAWSHAAVGEYTHVPLALLWLAVLITSYLTYQRLQASNVPIHSRSRSAELIKPIEARQKA